VHCQPHNQLRAVPKSKLFQDAFPSIKVPAPNLWQLFRPPVHQKSTPLHLEAKTIVLDNIIENLELIEPHQVYERSVTKCHLYERSVTQSLNSYLLLHSAPCFKCNKKLEVFNTAIKNNMEKICNVSFGKENWSQASNPYQSDMQAWVFVVLQTCPCHVSCHCLMLVRASSTVYLPLLTWNSLMGMQLMLGPSTMIHQHYKRNTSSLV